MKRNVHKTRTLAFCLVAALLLCACDSGSNTNVSLESVSGDASEATGGRETVHDFLSPEASGTVVYESQGVLVDASNTADGYVMVQYSGDAPRVRLQITDPNEVLYSYPIVVDRAEPAAFPLSGGDGTYEVCVLENVVDDMYALVFTQDIDVALSDEFSPFLYPNQYVDFKAEDPAVALGVELSDGSTDDLNYLTNVYHYVTESISYDEELAKDIPIDYIPDNTVTLETGKGICFDYASLMASMLRSQKIPTRLEVGYAGTVYHAWISAYLDEIGWVDRVIQFDGTSWSLIDPTLAANNNSASVSAYIGDGTNYSIKYTY